jgi:DNA-binding transcriptional ArsR family regulator
MCQDAVFRALSAGPLPRFELREKADLSEFALSRTLRQLREAGVIRYIRSRRTWEREPTKGDGHG